MTLRKILGAIVVLVLGSAAMAQSVALPPAGGQYDSQLGGAYEPPAGTVIVSRDRADPAAPGLYNICYINAFQTQPQETDWWLANHADLLLRQYGELAEDLNWPGEILLDTSTDAKRAGLAAIVGSWIQQCARDGYDAIEADNLDTYSRSDGALSIDDNLRYVAALVEKAHGLGLAFGQKNGGELADRGKAVGLDFAIVESCQVYEECEGYTEVFGAHVLEIEYTDTDERYFNEACTVRGSKISVIRRDRNLTIPRKPSYFYKTC